MKRTRLRRVSKKTAARNAEARPFREALKASVGRCEVCGKSPRETRADYIAWRLQAHEISRSNNRSKSQDQPHCILVLCWLCHTRIHADPAWTEARQLACLKRNRGSDYDLAAYNRIKGCGKKVSQADVDKYMETQE